MRKAKRSGIVALAAALVAAAAGYVFIDDVAHAAQVAQAPTGSTQLLFEQAIGDSGFHELDASSAADVRLAARGLNCPSGASFRVALYVSTAAGPILLDQMGASCAEGVTRTYESVVGVNLDAVVSDRQLVDGTAGAFSVDVAVFGRP